MIRLFFLLACPLVIANIVDAASLIPLEGVGKYTLVTCEQADFLLGIYGIHKPKRLIIDVVDIEGDSVNRVSLSPIAVSYGKSFVHVRGLVDTCKVNGWFKLKPIVVSENGNRTELHSNVAFVVSPAGIEGFGFWGLAGFWGLEGATSRFSENDALMLKKSGIRWIRFFVAWRKMRNKIDWVPVWRQLDNMCVIANSYGLELLPVLAVAPEFAVDSDKAGERAGIPSDEAWKSFVSAVGKRYSGRIHQWEIWNEPNIKIFWPGDVQSYAKKLETAYALLKEIDSSNIVIVGGMSGVDVRWARHLVAITHDFDVLAVHAYRREEPEGKNILFGHYGGSTLAYDIRRLRKILPVDKTIWITETGLNTRGGRKGLFSSVSEVEQAARLVRYTLIAKAEGVSRAYWWLLKDTFGLGTGLLKRKWSACFPKPSLAAMAWINHIIAPESDVKRISIDKGIWRYVILGPKKNWQVAWSLRSFSSLKLPCSISSYVDMTGRRHQLLKLNEIKCKIPLRKGMPVFWEE